MRSVTQRSRQPGASAAARPELPSSTERHGGGGNVEEVEQREVHETCTRRCCEKIVEGTRRQRVRQQREARERDRRALARLFPGEVRTQSGST
jgi:hypothetical protein